jgi:hypothetical protein
MKMGKRSWAWKWASDGISMGMDENRSLRLKGWDDEHGFLFLAENLRNER